MSKEQWMEQLKNAIVEGEKEMAMQAVNEALHEGVPAMGILNEGAAKGMDALGILYNDGDAFLPELVLAGDIMTEIVDVLFPDTEGSNQVQESEGVVVIGQAKGDVHDIGKNIVSIMLSVGGFKVHDIGIDVEPAVFVEKSIELNADIIGISVLMTTSLPYLRETVKYAEEAGIRDNVKIIFGGSATTQDYTDASGGDGWSKSAIEAVELCKRLMLEKRD